MRVRSSIGRPQAARAMPGPVPRPQRASSAASVRGTLLVLLPVLLLAATHTSALATSPSPATGMSTTASPAACPAQGPAHLLLAADDAIHGTEPWVTDGTPEGTRLLADINAGSASSDPYAIAVIAGVLYLTANDGVHGTELWRTDGTPEGTWLLADTQTAPGRGIRGWRGVATAATSDDRLLLALPGRAGAATLWSTDGTPEGTVRLLPDEGPVALIGPPSGPGPAFVLSGDARAGWHLWRSDGTDEGTRPLIDLAPIVEPSEADWDAYPDDAPRLLTVLGDGTLLFVATDTTSLPWTHWLWASDGTPGGTRRLAAMGTIRLITGAQDPASPVILGEDAYFFAVDASGPAFWATDGTPEGTRRLRSLRSRLDDTRRGVVLDGRLSFAARGEAGPELWQTDGTETGTRSLTDLPAGAEVVDIVAFDGRALFTVRERDGSTGLWWIDRSRATPRRIRELPRFRGWVTGLFLPAARHGVPFVETRRTAPTFPGYPAVLGLAVTDGTRDGTVPLGGPGRRVDDGPSSDAPLAAHTREAFPALAVDGTVFVHTWDSGLWATDGTPGGTRRLSTVMPSSLLGAVTPGRSCTGSGDAAAE